MGVWRNLNNESKESSGGGGVAASLRKQGKIKITEDTNLNNVNSSSMPQINSVGSMIEGLGLGKSMDTSIQEKAKRTISPTQTMSSFPSSSSPVPTATIAPVTNYTPREEIMNRNDTLTSGVTEYNNLPWYKKIFADKPSSMQRQEGRDYADVELMPWSTRMSPGNSIVNGLRGAANTLWKMGKGQGELFDTDYQKGYDERMAEKYEEKGTAGKLVSDLQSGFGSMAGAMLTGSPAVNLAVTGVTAGGQNAQQAMDQGATPQQAFVHGATTGAAEALTEKLFGFMPGPKMFDDMMPAITQNGAKNVKNIIGKYLGKSLGEGVEEAVMDPVTAVSERLTYKPEDDWKMTGEGGIFDAKQMAYDALLGTILGGVMGGMAIPSHVSNAKAGAADMRENIDSDLRIANALPKNYESNKMASTIMKSPEFVTYDNYNQFTAQLRTDLQAWNVIEQRQSQYDPPKPMVASSMEAGKRFSIQNDNGLIRRPQEQSFQQEPQTILPQQENPVISRPAEDNLTAAARKFAVKKMEAGKTFSYKQEESIQGQNTVPNEDSNDLIFKRVEEKGVNDRATIDKPHGIYVTPNVKSQLNEDYAKDGGKTFLWKKNKDANDLVLDVGTFRTNRGLVGESAGVGAARKFLGDEEVSRLMKMTKKDLTGFLQGKYPKTEWSRYYDQQEMVEGYAGLIAREKGYDGIYAKDKNSKNKELDEYTALTDNAMTPIDDEEAKASNKYEVGTKLKSSNGSNYEITKANGNKFTVKNTDSNFEIEVSKERLDQGYSVAEDKPVDKTEPKGKESSTEVKATESETKPEPKVVLEENKDPEIQKKLEELKNVFPEKEQNETAEELIAPYLDIVANDSKVINSIKNSDEQNTKATILSTLKDVLAKSYTQDKQSGKADIKKYGKLLDIIANDTLINDYTDLIYDKAKQIGSPKEPDKVDILVDKITELVDTIKGNNDTIKKETQQAPEEKPAEPKKEKKLDQPHDKIADKVLEFIKEGKSFSSDKLFQIANEAYNGTMAAGDYTVKDAYDAMELAVNRYILEMPMTNDVMKNVKLLEDVLNRIPTQPPKRTTEMEQFQQFSTPPTISYVANWIADISNNDITIEPSAGIGGIAVFAKKEGATVYVNEYSKRRLGIIESLPFDGFYNENAEQLNNVLPKNIKPTVIVMNPPFSATAGRTSKNSSKNAEAHIEQALKRLEPNGRLVAIVGQGMADNMPQFKDWWPKIKNEYNVRANIGLDGKNYKKYGTTYNIQILVIYKNGPTTQPVLTTFFENLTDIPKAMEGIRNERPTIEVKQNTAINRSNEVIEQSRPESTVPATSNPRSEQGTRVSNETPSTDVRGTDTGRTTDTGTRNDIQATNNGIDGTGRIENVENVKGQEAENVEATGLRTSESGRDGNVEKLETVEKTKTKEEIKKAKKVSEENSDDVYSYYTPKKLKIKGIKKHPAMLVESAAMSAVEPPDLTYIPKLPKELVESGVWSDAQLEYLSYAGQAHSQMLPNGTRKGIFNGDGTGVGKGRQIAGLILDNFNNGRRKAVWISENKTLFNDAARDWKDVGQDVKQLLSVEKVGAKDNIPIKEGIFFTTYSTMLMGSTINSGQIQENDNSSRLNQLVRWLGKDFDGVIVFDEAHNMSNAIGDDAAGKAVTGIKLQELLPNARIAYFSATGATEVSNLAYAPRLGMWGEGTAFRNVNDFIKDVSAGGLATMELVAKDMKSVGSYIARNISYKGVEYSTLTHNLSPVQKEIYDTLARSWQLVISETENALASTMQAKDSRAKGRILSQLFSNQQRFFNQILVSMSMPSLVKDIQKNIEDGKSVVLQLTSTNEAAQTKAIAKATVENTDLDDIEISPREMLLGYLRTSFPTAQMEEYEEMGVDNFGRSKPVKKYRYVLDSQGNRVENADAVALRESLIEDVEQIKTPDAPIDFILNTFGVENVSEVTGRKKRLIKDSSTGKMKMETRQVNYKVADTDAFQSGQKRILIFSDAGGTGRSYHSSLSAKNQQQRVHYLIQAGWSAPKAMQGFGRTHRSAQANTPKYSLVTTNIMGQKRFISTIAKRLDQMGALTKGERKASGGIFNAKDNLESDIAKDTLVTFYRDLFNERVVGIDGQEVMKKMNVLGKFTDKDGRFQENLNFGSNTGTFLNRILQLEVDEQNKVFEEFAMRVSDNTDAAIASGKIDLGLENYKAEKIEVKDEVVVRTDPQSGAETKYIQMTAFKKPYIMEFDQVEGFREKFTGLYKNKETGEVRAVYRTKDQTKPDGSVVQYYRLFSPMLGSEQTFAQSTMDTKMEAIDKKKWRENWNKEVENVPEFTEETLHIFTGTLLPIWNKLPSNNVKVYRIVDDNGNEYLGRIIHASQIDETLRKFDTKRTRETFDANDVYKNVMEKGKIAVLENDGIRIQRRRVSGENRIEISGSNMRFTQRAYPYIFKETIQSQERYFIPTGERGMDILKSIIGDNPVAAMENSNTRSESNTEGLTSRNGGQTLGAATGANTTGKAKKASQIYKEFSEKLGLAVRQGRVGRDRLGEFDNRNYLVRIRDANDLPTLSHETGHYFDRLYDLSTNRSHSTELEALGQATSRPSYSKARVRREGVAEFVRLYLTDGDAAMNQAPGFYNSFEQQMPDEVIETLQELRKEIWALVNLDPVARVKKSISFGSDETSLDKLKTIKDMDIVAGARKFYTGMVDATYPLEWAASKVSKNAKQDIEAKLAQLRGYEGIALYDLNPNINKEFHQLNLAGKHVGLSYGAITKYIHESKDKREDFMAYQVARRARDYRDKGLNMPDTNATYEATIQELEQKYPEFIETFDRLTKYRYNNSKLLADAGIYSEEQLDEMYMANRNYVSLKRIMDAFDFVSGSGSKMGAAKKLIKRVAGSGRDIMDPEESDINNTFLYRAAAMRNKVLQDLTGMFDHDINPQATEGMGWLISRAPAKVQPVNFNLEQVRSYLENEGIDTSGMDLDIMARVFIPNYLARENQIVVYRDGRPVLYDVHPELYSAISGMRFEQLEWITKPLVAIASVQRAGIIYTEKYIMNNFARDTGGSLISSKSGIKPWSIVGGLYHTLLKTSTYKDAMRYGATTNYSAVNERDYAQDAIRDINNSSSRYRKVVSKLPPWRWLRLVRDTIEPFEMAARVAEYKRYLKQTGESDENIKKAVAAARDLSVDFRRMGSWVKALQLNSISLFFNSQIQGSDKFFRTFKDNPGRTTLRGFMYLTLPTLLLMAVNHDDEDYKNLPQWRKDLFWNIPLGGGVFFPIPIPYEFGIAFKVLPERMVSAFILENPKAWRELSDTLYTTFVPKPSISALQPEFDIWANRDWKGSPVESRSDLEVSPELRYNSYTSEISKSLGEVTGQSPKKIDHLIKGHFGTLGKTALDTYDSILSPDKKEYGGGYFKKFVVDSNQSPESISDFYDNYADVRTMNADARRLGGKPNALEKALNSEFMKAAEELNKIKDLQTIVDKKNLNNEKLIDAALQKAMIEKTKKINKLYDAAKKITEK